MANRPNRLREFRAKKELTQTQVAERLEVTPHTVLRWEKSKTEVPDRAKFALSKLYDVPIVTLFPWLVTGNDEDAAA